MKAPRRVGGHLTIITFAAYVLSFVTLAMIASFGAPVWANAVPIVLCFVPFGMARATRRSTSHP